ncbi:MAG: shikimate dehydrogenase, partial [Gammaproteobacteria bacterium]
MTHAQDTSLKRCAVIGDPVEHSKSPRIHRRFAEQTGIKLDYSAFRVELSAVEEFAKKYFREGGTGLNITVPLKQAAFQLCDSTSPRATLAAAVNTLYLSDGRLYGENTDGPGLIQDLQGNQGISLSGARTLVLGAGGAVRGVLAAFVETDIGDIVVANRTQEKALKLETDRADHLRLRVAAFDDLGLEPFDLIINGTTASLGGNMLQISSRLVNSASCCYDLMYADTDTPFVAWAKQSGAGLALDGLG